MASERPKGDCVKLRAHDGGGGGIVVRVLVPLCISFSPQDFLGSRISKIALVLDYDLLEATYWPPSDL